MVWSWFVYVLAANLLLVIPLLWVAAWWSLRPIESLAKEVRELEDITAKSSIPTPLAS
ncbi:sensor protein PhoQ [Klebsiella pneumoniae]|uniref:Sensor protein PhoQ n=1 Tax=Klebsiella pneumoniae TaxID=573 RepID=A0A377V3J7_KLEPN|nr:sensor protein PhoQ [Klebsiella pneumoniae]